MFVSDLEDGGSFLPACLSILADTWNSVPSSTPPRVIDLGPRTTLAFIEDGASPT